MLLLQAMRIIRPDGGVSRELSTPATGKEQVNKTRLARHMTGGFQLDHTRVSP